MLTLPIASVHIEPGKALEGPIQREKRNRGNTAWLIRDTTTKSVILMQHLAAAAAWINRHNAQSRVEQVTVRSLYEALYVHSLPHKWRYHVSRWPLDGAHSALEHERAKDAQSVIVLSIERD